MKTFLKLFFLVATFLSRSLFASDLLVGSQNTHNFLRYNGETGEFIEVFIPTNPGDVSGSSGIAFDLNENLYIGSSANQQLIQFNGVDGSLIGPFGPASVTASGMILGPDGKLYVCNIVGGTVLQIDAQGNSITFAGGISVPTSLVFGPDGNLYVASVGSNSVRRFDGETGQLIGTFVAAGSGGLMTPFGIAFGPDGNLYVASGGTDSILQYDGSNGSFLGEFIAPNSGGLNSPIGLLFRSDGNLYVSSFSSNQVLRFDGSTGNFLDVFINSGSGGLSGPYFLTTFPAGALEFSMSQYEVDESAGTATIQINRNNGSSGEVTVQLTTSNGTAVAGTDYTDISQVLTFSDGETAKTVLIPILDNSLINESKTVNLALSDPTYDATLGTIATAVLTIVDDDHGGGGGCRLGSGLHEGSWKIFLFSLALLAALKIFFAFHPIRNSKHQL